MSREDLLPIRDSGRWFGFGATSPRSKSYLGGTATGTLTLRISRGRSSVRTWIHWLTATVLSRKRRNGTAVPEAASQADDAPRPEGPPQKMVAAREELTPMLSQYLDRCEYDQQSWSAKLLLHYVKEEYGVEYHETYA